MDREIIATDKAPAAVGTYSQAVRHGDLVFLSGQIPLDPATMEIVEGDIAAQIHRVFQNLGAVCEAAGVVRVGDHRLDFSHRPVDRGALIGLVVSLGGGDHEPDLVDEAAPAAIDQDRSSLHACEFSGRDQIAC